MRSLISKVVPEKLRGTAFGLFATSLGLVSLPSPWIGGQLWDSISPRAPFLFSVGAIFIVLPIIWVKFRLPKSTGAPEDTTAVAAPELTAAGAVEP